VPTELIEHPELFSLFESILYADFKAIETYDPSLETKLQLPITVIAGRDDEIIKSRLELWADVTTAEIEIHLFPGGHFYLYDNLQEVASLLLNRIPNTESIPVAA
jgi:medium-chain acyl-[acyl-carrier-protein] hydrolase